MFAPQAGTMLSARLGGLRCVRRGSDRARVEGVIGLSVVTGYEPTCRRRRRRRFHGVAPSGRDIGGEADNMQALESYRALLELEPVGLGSAHFVFGHRQETALLEVLVNDVEHFLGDVGGGHHRVRGIVG
jgi:hypothetical protein